MEEWKIPKRRVAVKSYIRNDGVKVRGYSYLREKSPKYTRRRSTSREGTIFCETCGAFLIPKKTNSGVRLICPRCKTDIDASGSIISTKFTHSDKDKTIILDKPDESFTEKGFCEKCGKRVRFKTWQVQLRSSDEPATTFYRCENGHTWRESI